MLPPRCCVINDLKPDTIPDSLHNQSLIHRIHRNPASPSSITHDTKIPQPTIHQLKTSKHQIKITQTRFTQPRSHNQDHTTKSHTTKIRRSKIHTTNDHTFSQDHSVFVDQTTKITQRKIHTTSIEPRYRSSDGKLSWTYNTSSLFASVSVPASPKRHSFSLLSERFRWSSGGHCSPLSFI